MNLIGVQRPAYAFRMNNLWNELLNEYTIPANNKHLQSVPVNIIENEDDFQLQFSVPGFEKENFSVKQTKSVLTIKGEIKKQEENDGEYRKKEFALNSFERSFNLPETIDVEKINASYTNGILVVMLPKKEQLVQKGEFEIAIQ